MIAKTFSRHLEGHHCKHGRCGFHIRCRL